MKYAAIAGLAVAGLAFSPGISHPAPVSLTISPSVISTGNHHFSQSVTLTNRSASPVRIIAGTIAINSGQNTCAAVKAPSWLRVSPASFTIPAGGHEVTRVTVAAPASASGHAYDLAATYRATTPQKSGVSVSGAVGTRLLLSYGHSTKAAACVVHKPKALAAGSSSGGLPGYWLVGLIALVAILAVVAIAVYLRRRNRKDVPWWDQPGDSHRKAPHGGSHRAPRHNLRNQPEDR